ncbi:MAG: hypothetical protein EPN22_04735 [Nitrospirae bacterium]|nr:MAG: hypothetical protein EPN22_04735 [Nitrospirota bacterium]
MIGKRKIFASLAVVLFFLCVLGLSFYFGRSGRIFLNRPKVIFVDRPAEALRVWKSFGVRGRILVLFDRTNRMGGDEGAEAFSVALPGASTATDFNYVDLAIRDNTVRKVWHVIPDRQWEEAAGNLNRNPLARRHGGVFSLVLTSTEFSITKPEGLPVTAEPVLLNMNGEALSFHDYEAILSLMEKGAFRPDVVVISGDVPEEIRRKIGRNESR